VKFDRNGRRVNVEPVATTSHSTSR
jgi:hypothetical protein